MQQIPSRAPRLQKNYRPERISAHRLLNRGLPANTVITLRVRWPLAALPFLLLAQIAMPDPVWTTTGVVILVCYVGAWLWVRALAHNLRLERNRHGTLLVVGDTLEEEFRVFNNGSTPAVWAELVDASTLPGYNVCRAVAVGANSSEKWRTTAICPRRGLFQLGPHTLRSGDPLHLFELSLHDDRSEALLIHPRVVQLPSFPLPRGYASGDNRTRRPLLGALPSAAVRNYQPFDDTRFIHWPSTARQGRLMVREMEQEPSGDIWLLFDADSRAVALEGDFSTLETGLMVTSSLAAQFLESSSGRAVGLLTATGEDAAAVTVAPAAGRAHLWRILAALAPLDPAPLSLGSLLAAGRTHAGSRSSLVVVTSQLADTVAVMRWSAEVVRIASSGAAVGVLLIATAETTAAAEDLRTLLARHAIPVQVLPVDAHFTALITHRRRRTELRSTPSGGVVRVEVVEEVA
jgi:uncharacterized protein (DUF58 family)